MSSSSLFARTLGRRVLASTFRTKVASPQLGAIRLKTYYTQSHEWIKVDGDVGTIGITWYAQDQLGDCVMVELPEIGDELEKDDVFAGVESVKAAGDVYVPVPGKIVEINETLTSEPERVNESPEDQAWFAKIEITDTAPLNDLMDAAEYKNYSNE
eukprot:jgi/Psemu1/313526/fgenesh1_kg.1223_\